MKKIIKIFLHYGDLTDAISINRLINLIKPDEIYNLAAQSHVAVSFIIPNYTKCRCFRLFKYFRSNQVLRIDKKS